jgi:hypothetical protein
MLLASINIYTHQELGGDFRPWGGLIPVAAPLAAIPRTTAEMRLYKSVRPRDLPQSQSTLRPVR